MTRGKTKRGKLVHEISEADPTSTICNRPAQTLVLTDAPVTCRRCVRHAR